jgi:Spy/CpxP family protein refolding chaperone
MMIFQKLSWLAIGLAVALAAPTAFAQPKANRAKVQERIKKLRSEVLRKHVGLDEAKAKQVEKLLDKYEPQRQAAQQQMRQKQRTLGALLKADSNDQQAYKNAIKGYRDADKKLRSVRDKEFDEISKLITPKQQAKLVVALRKMQAKIRSAMRRRARDNR